MGLVFVLLFMVLMILKLEISLLFWLSLRRVAAAAADTAECAAVCVFWVGLARDLNGGVKTGISIGDRLVSPRLDMLW